MLEVFDEVMVKIPEKNYFNKMFFLFELKKHRNFYLLVDIKQRDYNDYYYEIVCVEKKYVYQIDCLKRFLILEKNKKNIELIKNDNKVFVSKKSLPIFIEFVKTTENYYYNYHKLKGPTLFNKITYWLKTKLKIY
jgi:hypothetical protein